jgi:hypothetical protein
MLRISNMYLQYTPYGINTFPMDAVCTCLHYVYNNNIKHIYVLQVARST